MIMYISARASVIGLWAIDYTSNLNIKTYLLQSMMQIKVHRPTGKYKKIMKYFPFHPNPSLIFFEKLVKGVKH